MAGIRDLILAAQSGDLVRFSDVYADEFGRTRADDEAAGAFGGYATMDPDADYTRRDKRKRGKAGSTMGDAPTKLGGWVQKGLGTQMANNAGMAPHEFQDMNSVLSILLDDSGKIKGMGTIIKDIGKSIGMGIVLNF